MMNKTSFSFGGAMSEVTRDKIIGHLYRITGSKSTQWNAIVDTHGCTNFNCNRLLGQATYDRCEAFVSGVRCGMYL